MKRKLEGGEICDISKNKDQNTRSILETKSSTTDANTREVGENNIEKLLASVSDDLIIKLVLARGQDCLIKLGNQIKLLNDMPHKNMFIGFRITSSNAANQVSTTKIVWHNLPFNHLLTKCQTMEEYIRKYFSNKGGFPLLNKPFLISQIFCNNSNATWHITSPKCEYSFVHILPMTNIKVLQNTHCSDELAFIIDSSVPLVETFIGPLIIYDYKK